MARLGSFSRLLVPAQWFGETTTVNGWFGADDLIEASAPSGAISATCSATASQTAALTGAGSLSGTVAATASQTATISGGLGSIRCDASGDNITYSTSAPSGSSHSVIFFARPRADRNTYSCPMSIDAGTTDYVYAETEVDGLVMKMWDDSGGSITGPTMSVDTWYVFAWTKNGTTINFYHATSGSTTLTSDGSITGTTLTPTQVRMLESPWTGEWFDGDIFGVRIWSGAVLSQSELEAEMVQARANRTSNLWFEGFFFGASDLTDYSGNGRNFTGGGSLTTEDPPSGIPLFANSGAMSATAAATASQTASLIGSGALAATVVATASQTASLTGTGALAASLAATASQTATMTAISAMTATVGATTGQTATLIGSGALVASLAATAGQTATLTGTGALLASLAAQAGVTATLTGNGALAASLAAQTGSTAALTGTGALLATIGATAGVTANLTTAGSGAMTATVGSTTSQTASLLGSGALVATIASVAAGTYSLTGTGAMSASAGATASGSASLAGIGSLSANVPVTTGHSADLIGFGMGALNAVLPANTNATGTLSYTVEAGLPGIVIANEFLAGLVDIWSGASSETKAIEYMEAYCNMAEYLGDIGVATEHSPSVEYEEFKEGVAS